MTSSSALRSRRICSASPVEDRCSGRTSDYIPAISHQESLRNLVFPLDGTPVVRDIGLPLHPEGRADGWKDVYI